MAAVVSRCLIDEVFEPGGQLYQAAIRTPIEGYLGEGWVALHERFVKVISMGPLPKYADLTFLGNILHHLGKPAHLRDAGRIAGSIYEAPLREVLGTKRGIVYPMNPEVMAYAMVAAHNQVVVEIGGASGENAILLALAGAKKVYMIDITREEVEKCRELIRALPSDLAERIEPIEGDSMDLLQIMHKEIGKVGLVLCRNLIHFQNNQRLKQLFKSMKVLQTDEGQAIFTTNAVYCDASQRAAFEANRNCVSFAHMHLILNDLSIDSNPAYGTAVLCTDIAPCSDDEISRAPIQARLFSRETGKEWQMDNQNFRELDGRLQQKIMEAIGQPANRDKMSETSWGAVTVIVRRSRFYSMRTLPALFKAHNFAVVDSFCLRRNGHLSNDRDLWRAYPAGDPGAPGANLVNIQVGVIVKKTMIKKL